MLHPTHQAPPIGEPDSSVTHLLNSARLRGANIEQVFADAGLRTERPDRLPNARYFALWQAVSRQIADPALALHAALDAPFSEHLSPVAFLSAVSTNLQVCLERWLRYWPVGSHLLRWGLVIEGNGTWIITGEPVDPPSPARALAIECLVADAIYVTRQGPERPIQPGIVLPHDRAGMVGDFKRMMDLRVQPGDRVEVHFDAADLAAPFARADDALSGFFERQVRAALRAQAPETRQRIEQMIVDALPSGELPSLSDTAGALGMSAATLQRQLRGEGAGYRAIVESVQRAEAFALLTRRGVRSSDVAFATGFSSQRAFCRAFRRWTGLTPSDWTRQAG